MTPEEPEPGGLEEWPQCTILVETGGRNQTLLTEWLTNDLGHTVTRAATAGGDTDIDLIILDQQSVRDQGEEIYAMKTAAHPVFTPVVLVVPEDSGTTSIHGAEQLHDGQGSLVDAVFEMPLSKAALNRRLGNLVQIRRQSQELLDREKHFQKLLNQNLSGIFLAVDSRFSYVNTRLATMFGYERDEMLGLRTDELAAAIDRDRLRTVVDAFQAEEIDHIEGTFEGSRTDGDPIYFMLDAQETDLAEGRATLGTVIDITNRIEAERKAENRAEQLAVLNQIIRHDIGNDLNVILGWGETLYGNVDEEGRKILDRILNTAYHMHELTKSVRDLAKLLDDSTEFQLDRIDLAEVLAVEIDTVRARFEGTHELTVNFDPDEVDDIQVQATGMLSSIFDNLLTNAIRHNNKPKTVIDVSIDPDPERVAVHIADNGPGIPDERKETIFGRGEKGLKSSGTGLGLYLVSHVVEEYGGTVLVSDNEPVGTVFTVVLPRA